MSAELAELLRAATPSQSVRRDFEPTTRLFGPRPPAPAVVGQRRSTTPVLLVPLLLLAGLGLARLRPATNASPPGSCAGASIPAPAGAQVVRGDAGGVGCLTIGVYADEVLTIRLQSTDSEPRRFALGLPGDRLFLGDWNCDGIATPALLRPSTGAALYFDTWSTNETPSNDANRCRSIG